MLDAMLHARSVAVIGASKGTTETGGAKIGAAALNYLVDHGFDGPIFPVNPRYQELAGRRCYANVRDIEDGVDLALIVLRAGACVQAMEDCAAKGVKVAVVFAAGFAEAGDSALQDRLLGAARAGGVRLSAPIPTVSSTPSTIWSAAPPRSATSTRSPAAISPSSARAGRSAARCWDAPWRRAQVSAIR